MAVRDEIKKLVAFDFLNLNDVNAIRARKSVDFLVLPERLDIFSIWKLKRKSFGHFMTS
jgi:hypothetical protein